MWIRESDAGGDVADVIIAPRIHAREGRSGGPGEAFGRKFRGPAKKYSESDGPPGSDRSECPTDIGFSGFGPKFFVLLSVPLAWM